MTLNVLLWYFVPEHHDAFVYLIEVQDYTDMFFLMQILTPNFQRPLVLVSKISPEQNTDFDCPYPKLEIYQTRGPVVLYRSPEWTGYAELD